MKHFLTCFVLALCLVLCAFAASAPVTAQAAETVASGTCGKTLTWTLDSNGLLVISGSGEMDMGIDPERIPWYAVKDSVKEVRIPKEVSFMHGNLFAGCSNLVKIVVDTENPKYCSDSNGILFNKDKSVILAVPGKYSGRYTIADSVTTIHDYAFYGCAGLTGVTFPNGKLHLGQGAFQNCTGLTSIELPDTVSATPLSLFMGCTNLKTVVLNANFTEIPNAMFKNCVALTSIRLPDTVTQIGYNAFEGCTSLASVTFSPKLKTIDPYAFKNCASLTSVQLPQGVNSIDSYAFQGCTKLKSANIPDSVRELGWGVFQSSGLTSIRIPGSINKMGNSVFEGCTALATVTIEEGITFINEKTFSGCSALTDITLPESLEEIGEVAFGNCTALTDIDLPDALEVIGENAFEGCSKLRNVTLGSHLEVIGPGAFMECDSFTEVIIPDNVIRIEFSAYHGCEQLSSVTIGNGVIHVGNYAFRDCNKLSSVTLGNSITHIGSGAFDCDALKQIVLPDSLTTISSSSFNTVDLDCYTIYDTGVYLGTADNPYHALVDVLEKDAENQPITSVILHKDTKIIASYGISGSDIEDVILSDSLISIGTGAFSYAPSLLYYFYSEGYYLGSQTNPYLALITPAYEITKPFVVHEDTLLIADGAFAEHPGLTEITLSPKLRRIGDDTFSGCTNLTYIEIPKGVTEIGDRAFNQCDSATSITIPASVKRLGIGAFGACSSLEKLDVEDLDVWLKAETLSDDSRPYSGEQEWQLCENGQPVADLVIPEGITKIRYKMFFGCGSINSVKIPDSVKKIGAYAFCNCPALTSVSIGKGVKEIGYWAFYCNTSLSDITVPGNVKSIGDSAFFACDSLTKVVIEPGVQKIEDMAFGYCDNIESITIGSGVTWIGEEAFRCAKNLKTLSLPATLKAVDDLAFANSDNLTEIYIEDLTAYLNVDFGMYADITNSASDLPKTLYVKGVAVSNLVIPNGITRIPDSAFAYCANITSVTIPDSVTEIGPDAFYGCTNLKQVKLGKGICSIGSSAFYGCEALTGIAIPDGVSVIRGNTFENCKKLASVTVPASVKEVEGWAFDECDALADVYYAASEANWKNIVFGSSNYDLSNAKIHYGQVASGADVTRVFGATRYETAFDAADMLKEKLGVDKFDNIVVACGTDFADALSGSYLANQKNAPILLVRNRNQEIEQVKAYIQANLKSGGTVYLLGGVNAIPKSMETGLDGFKVKRLAGATRYETSLAIIQEAGVGNKDILICTGKNFADGLSASAVNMPIMLVKDSLSASQKEFLQSLNGNKLVIIGGTAAVNTRIENALKAYGSVSRIEGATRYYTSVNIAKKYFPNATSMVVAYADNFPDGLSGGPLAYSQGAPLILSMNGKQSVAADYAKSMNIQSGMVLGGPTLISDKVVKQLFQMGESDIIQIK